jgi:phospholipase/carboxylesterase
VLSTFQIEPSKPQRGTVIWLHGLGATNHDFDPIVPELDAPFLRFIFPASRVRAVTINQGMRMPAWYDILSFDNPPLREKESDVRESAADLLELIEREHTRGARYEDIVLAGFSQGGAMALHVGLRSEQRLAGVLVLSGYMLLPDSFKSEAHAANQQTPVLHCHGRHDPVVPLSLGKSAFTRLTEAGYPAKWAEYEMEHSLCIEEVHHIRDWLKARFPNP